MHTFKPGTTYVGRSIGDADCVIRLTVASRTAKTIVTSEGKRLGVFIFGDAECVKPWGRYSMAPTIAADREARA
jgi:hypothetical protein